MHIRNLLVVTALVLVGVAALSAWWLDRRVDSEPAVPLDRALEGIDALAGHFPLPGAEALDWPRDHGAKPGQFAESWLFAGLVRDETGRSYGFQLAFERVALQKEAAARESAWGTRDLIRARFALEPSGARAHSEERVSRAALGLAGAEAAPAQAWLEDWSFTLDEAGGAFLLGAGGPGAAFALRLVMPSVPAVGIDSELYRGYWWPGLQVAGTLDVDGRPSAVDGQGMIERLWGRALPAGRGQLGLARLWLDVGDGRVVRCEQLRRRAGGGTPLMECLGHPARPGEDVELGPKEQGWETVAGIRYPLRWTLRLPETVDPLKLAPLSRGHTLSLDGAWRGIIVGDGDMERWGLLELSNFAAP